MTSFAYVTGNQPVLWKQIPARHFPADEQKKADCIKQYDEFIKTQQVLATARQEAICAYIPKETCIADETLTSIYAVWKKHQAILSLDQFQKVLEVYHHVKETNPDPCIRVKIQGLCSLTLIQNPSNQDQFYIHLKKKKNRCLMGSGACSNVYSCIVYQNNKFSLCAEKTLYIKNTTPLSSKVLDRLKSGSFLFSTKAPYRYRGCIKATLTKRFSTPKECEFLPLADIDLCSFIIANEEGNFLSDTSCWNILKFIARILADLHRQNLIHRDLKPENFVVKFNENKEGKVDLNNFSLFAIDVDTITEDSDTYRDWVGTPYYQPPQGRFFTELIRSFSLKISRELQRKPADIYAFGMIFDYLILQTKHFKELDPVKQELLLGFHKQLTASNAENRPNIEQVLLFLEQSNQGSLLNETGFNDLLAVCAIL